MNHRGFLFFHIIFAGDASLEIVTLRKYDNNVTPKVHTAFIPRDLLWYFRSSLWNEEVLSSAVFRDPDGAQYNHVSASSIYAINFTAFEHTFFSEFMHTVEMSLEVRSNIAGIWWRKFDIPPIILDTVLRLLFDYTILSFRIFGYRYAYIEIIDCL